MEFKRGTAVFAASGEQVGTIDRVVINPGTKVVTDIVVRKGVVFAEDKVVPIGFIASSTDDQIILRKRAGDLADLPPFEESHYVSLTPDEVDYATGSLSPLYPYPPLGTLPWTLPSPIEVLQNIPDNTVALKEDASVTSLDDKHVGKIERIFVEPKTKRVTHLLISHGVLMPERRIIPSMWVTGIEEDEVKLGVEYSVIKRLPSYGEQDFSPEGP